MNALLPDPALIAGAIASEVASAIPGYEGARAEEPGGPGAGIRRVAELVAACLRTGEGLSGSQRAEIEALGAARAAAGLSAEAVCAAVRTGFQRGWAIVVARADALVSDGVLDAAEVSRELGSLSQAVMALGHEVTDAMAAGHTRARAGSEEPDASDSARTVLARALLAGKVASDEALARLAEAAGWDLGRTHALACFVPIIEPGVPDEALHAVRTACAEAGEGVLAGVLCHAPVVHLAVVLDASAPAVLEAHVAAVGDLARRNGLRALVDAPFPAAECPVRYARCAELLGLVRAMPGGPGLLRPEALGLHRLVAAVPASVREEVLGPALRVLRRLPARRRAITAETLVALADAGGEVNRAAELLGISPRTVWSRQARIERWTGHRLAHPGERLHLELALRCFEDMVPFSASRGQEREQMLRSSAILAPKCIPRTNDFDPPHSA